MNGGSAINLIILYLFIYLLPLFIKTNDFSVKNDIYKNNLELQIENFIRWMAYCSFLFQSLGLIGGDSITRIAFYFSVFFTTIYTDNLQTCEIQITDIYMYNNIIYSFFFIMIHPRNFTILFRIYFFGN